MKNLSMVILVMAAWSATQSKIPAAILLDDTWADGTRNNQNLPSESAWFANNISSVPTLSATTGSMTGTVGTGSSIWITYFTDPGSPATLGIGDTLKVSAIFTPTGVAAQNANRGLRIGAFNFSNGGTRAAADGISTAGLGANVNGYMLNMNFGVTLGVNGPLQIQERTTVSSTSLMGTSGDFTTLSSGGGSTGDGGFVSGTQYTLEYSVTRTAADSVDITTKFTGGSLNISHTATDASGATFAFDSFAFRPNSAAQSASSLQFTEFKVEVFPVPEPSTFILSGLGVLGLITSRVWRKAK